MKILIILSITFFSFSTSFAQYDAPVKPNSRIGIEGGVNWAKVDSDLGGNTESIMGFHTGLVYQKFLSERFALQKGVYFSKEGWINNDADYKLSYINLKVLGKLYFFRGLNFQGGIQPGFILDSEVDNGSISSELPVKNFNLSALIGLGYDFGFGLRLGGRYLAGLIDINDGIDIGTKDDEIKTRTIQVYLGYTLPLPKSRRRMAYRPNK